MAFSRIASNSYSRKADIPRLVRRILPSSPSALRSVSAAGSTSSASADYLQGLPDSSASIHCVESIATDPYFNLSLEHHLLQRLPATAVLLFTYIDAPCVVIGRNQNPWVEANLGKLRSKPNHRGGSGLSESEDLKRWARPNYQLVRRRSGGGTVYHDLGNVNWTVICPKDIFTRGKHAEMITRALRKLGQGRTRVNERHDIVLDQGSRSEPGAPEAEDMHRTTFSPDDELGGGPLKISGSAYKIVKDKCLHHGTLLLESSNLAMISGLLQSPARPFINARGVESVRSRVGQVPLEAPRLIEAITDQFLEMYPAAPSSYEHRVIEESEDVAAVFKSGLEELRSDEWTYGQTPQFDFFTREPIAGLKAFVTVRSGIIERLTVSLAGQKPAAGVECQDAQGLQVWRMSSFKEPLRRLVPVMAEAGGADIGELSSRMDALSNWMDEKLLTSGAA